MTYLKQNKHDYFFSFKLSYILSQVLIKFELISENCILTKTDDICNIIPIAVKQLLHEDLQLYLFQNLTEINYNFFTQFLYLEVFEPK